MIYLFSAFSPWLTGCQPAWLWFITPLQLNWFICREDCVLGVITPNRWCSCDDHWRCTVYWLPFCSQHLHIHCSQVVSVLIILWARALLIDIVSHRSQVRLSSSTSIAYQYRSPSFAACEWNDRISSSNITDWCRSPPFTAYLLWSSSCMPGAECLGPWFTTPGVEHLSAWFTMPGAGCSLRAWFIIHPWTWGWMPQLVVVQLSGPGPTPPTSRTFCSISQLNSLYLLLAGLNRLQPTNRGFISRVELKLYKL